MKKLTALVLSLGAMINTTEILAQENYDEEKHQYGLVSEEPVIEHRADRVLIFPQRMALNDDISVMDLLMMFPEALSRNYENLDDRYVVRVENYNYEADIRIFLSTLKAKYVEKIQVCDNPDVMKGRKNLGGVIDINMVRGALEKDVYIGGECNTRGLKHAPIANVIYGNGKTDVLLTASLTDDSRLGNYNATSRCAAKINTALNENHNLMYDIAARYGHSSWDGFTDSRFYGGQIQYDGIFNEKGTMLTVSADVEYYDDGFVSQSSEPLANSQRNKEVWQVYIVELNTPIAEGLDLCAGWEGDYANTNLNFKQQLALSNIERQDIATAFQLKDLTNDFAVKDRFETYNNDAYLQLDYSKGPWSFSVGDRVMFFHYGYKNDINDTKEKNNPAYNLAVASAILKPNYHHQIQGAYYRRFVTPNSYDTHNYLHFDTDGKSITTGNPNLDYQPADVYRVSYTYTCQKIWASIIGRYIDTHDIVIDTENTFKDIPVATWTNDKASCGITNIDASLTFTQGALTLVCGGSFYNKNYHKENLSYGYARLAPSLRLPGKWKFEAQALWCSDKTLEKITTDSNFYGMLSAQKTFGEHLSFAAQWHDIFCEDLSTVNFRLLYYF